VSNSHASAYVSIASHSREGDGFSVVGHTILLSAMVRPPSLHLMFYRPNSGPLALRRLLLPRPARVHGVGEAEPATLR